MTIYSYVAAACRAEAARQSRLPEIERLADRIEATQDRSVIPDRFLPTPFLKKPLGKSHRLLAYELEVDDDVVIAFLHLWTRGGKEYKEWLDRRHEDAYRAGVFVSATSAEELRRWVTQRRTDGPVTPLPRPAEEELRWLGQEPFPPDELRHDTLVLESREWVREMGRPERCDLRALYHDVLLSGWRQDDPAQVEAWSDRHQLGVLLRYFPRSNVLFLALPLDALSRLRLSLERERFRGLYALEDGASNTRESLSRMASRSYPQILIADRDMWLAIQREEDVNLALSPEESGVLESVRYSHGSEGGFPLFINGRAGSGKSTMLHYLASDLLSFALRQVDADGRSGPRLIPLYLTCSSGLRDVARRVVLRLMRSHASSLLAERTIDDSVLETIGKRSFRVFHEYLRSLVPEATRREKFAPDHYVDLARFRVLWSQSFGRRGDRDLSCDLAWHAIRTFIKGMRAVHEEDDEEFDPDDYVELPRRQASISSAAYGRIYNEVWKQWYHPLCKGGLWDDQDLAITLLRNPDLLDAEEYPAIICDEAQDFTRVELELIMRLSVFTRRSLRPHELDHLPFAFAGDPLQTLNPTGFRWDAVRAAFHEKLTQGLHCTGTKQLKLKYRELERNYRSGQGIVRFCNLLQALRSAIFAADVRPQEAWATEDDCTVIPCFFDLESPWIIDCMRKRSDITMIVNCDDGEEGQFVDSDQYLSDATVISRDEKGVPRNVLSPAKAKGLEFQEVVLYRFGESCPVDVQRLLSAAKTASTEEMLPLEYYFNRLYVAASRARHRLLIVDSAVGRRKILDLLFDLDAFWETSADLRSLRRVWGTHVAAMVPGERSNWDGDPIDQLAMAEQFRDAGRGQRDSTLLRRARQYYQALNRSNDAKECLADALELEQEWRAAGDVFAELRHVERARGAFWRGNAFERIVCLPKDAHPIWIYSNWHTSGRPLDGATETLAVIATALEMEAFRRQVAEDDRWWKAVRELLVVIVRAPDGGLGGLQWRRAYLDAIRLRKVGCAVDGLEIGMLAYRMNDLGTAIEEWDRCKEVNRSEEYKDAKARITPFPENLAWLQRLNRHSEVVAEWLRARGSMEPPPSAETIVIVVDSALRAGSVKQAVDALELAPNERQLLEAIGASIEHGARGEGRRALGLLLGMRVAAGATTEIVRWLNPQVAGPPPRDLDAQAAELVGDDRNSISGLWPSVVLAMARCDAVDGKARKDNSEFLRRVMKPDHKRWLIAGGCVRSRVAGAALERSAYDVDALEFYEGARDALPEGSGEWVHAVRRWAETKRRRIDALGDAKGSQDRAQLERWEQKYNQWLTGAEPRLPMIDGIRDDRPESALGDLEFSPSREKRVLKIRLLSTADDVRADVAQRRVRSEDIQNIRELQPGVWLIEPWRLTVHFRESGVRVERGDESRGFEL